jgi:predicted alpha/beta hydrolase family esterase
MKRRMTESGLRMVLMPGLHNSGERHWQSLWQRRYDDMERVEQEDWDHPQLETWSRRLDQVLAADPRPTLVLAHSFGCLATVYSLARDTGHIAGALLVAPADPDRFGVGHLLPQHALNCTTVLIASANDPWMSLSRAAAWARHWDSQFINIGDAGHINADSGLGDWRYGQAQMRRLARAAITTYSSG